MTEAAHAGFVANRLGKGLAQGDADVLHRVVAIDVQIALCLDVQVQHAMAGHLVEHVLEKGHAGGKPGRAFAVQVELHPDLRFLRISGDFSCSH
jgi:hypothetical protein